MGLSCYFQIHAPADKEPHELERFLKTIEQEARRLGFEPTLVLDARFDTEERRQFARRLTTGHRIQHDRLRGTVPLRKGQVFSHSPSDGTCCVIPERGVILVVTNEGGAEAVVGFFRYPATLKGPRGRDLLETGLGRDWFFRDSTKSPDPRFRKLLRMFAEEGYLRDLKDEFQPLEKA
jgi:hypothetical protein